MIRNFGPDLFLVGPTAGLVGDGTSFAVYDFLGEQLQIRWLWPGAGGEAIPHEDTVVAAGWDRVVVPQLLHSRLRADYGPVAETSGWADPADAAAFVADQKAWMLHHQLGAAITMDYNHSFGTAWWDTYGAAHPEWFNLLPDGTRRPDPYYPNYGPSICTSNPQLVDQVVTVWASSGQTWINACEADTASRDVDPCSMAMDVPQDNFESLFGCPWDQRLAWATNAFNSGDGAWYRYLGSVTNRYARFWLAVQQRAIARGYPDATVFGLSYQNYGGAYGPVGMEGQLNDRIVVGITPDLMFPWFDADRRKVLNLWDTWAGTGASLFLRPNYFLSGHNFPIYFADKFGVDFCHAYHHGMMATDFDSLTGQYATQGPNLYMLARIHSQAGRPTVPLSADLNNDDRVNLLDFAEMLNDYGTSNCLPDQPCYAADLNNDGAVDSADLVVMAGQWMHSRKSVPDRILDEYYGAFGPAEQAVRNYFALWRTVSDTTTITGSWTNYYVTAPQIFTPTVMAQARDLMTACQDAAAGDVHAQAAVAFLNEGLSNVELTLATQAAWQAYNASGDENMWLSALNALDDYRALVEADDIANMGYLRWAENRTWNRIFWDVTAGRIRGIGGDSVDDWSGLGFSCSTTEGNTQVHVLLDLQAVPAGTVDAIRWQNVGTDTQRNVHTAAVYVAPDESAPDFDPYDPADYTQGVFSGEVLPVDYSAGTWRTMDITDTTRRYILIDLTANGYGAIGTPDQWWNHDVLSGDVDVVMAP